MKYLKQMGEITVKLFHVKNIRRTEKGINQKDTIGNEAIPEKALKGRGISHQSR